MKSPEELAKDYKHLIRSHSSLIDNLRDQLEEHEARKKKDDKKYNDKD
jgi:hypothetical protein